MDVYFGGNFRYRGGEESEPGICVRSGAEFWYGNFLWRVLAVYMCREGIVLDICRQVPGESVRDFFDVWGRWQGREEDMGPELQRKAERENPFHFDVDFRLEMSGCVFKGSVGSSICIQPFGAERDAGAKECKPGKEQLEAGIALEYGLDRSDGWQIFRQSFRYEDLRCEEAGAAFEKAESGAGCGKAVFNESGKRGPLNFRLTVAAGDILVPCDCCFVTETGCGEHVQRFFHPVTGQQMELTVLGCREHALHIEESVLRGHMEGYRLPGCACVMEYVLKPAPGPGEAIVVSDWRRGDGPVFLSSPEADRKRAVSVSIIGGSAGPSSVFLAGKVKEEKDRVRSYAYSSLYFEPVRQVKWKVELRRALLGPETFELEAGGGKA